MDDEKKRKHNVEVQITQEEPSMKKSKKKKKDNEECTKPSITYNMEELFANGGKRAGGSYLNFTDIRALIMLTVHGERFPCLPTWCQLKNWRSIQKTVVILASGISSNHYKKYGESFKHLNKCFGNAGIPLFNEGNPQLLKSPLDSFLFYRMPRKLQMQKRDENRNSRVCSETKNYCDFVLTENQLQNNEFPIWNSSAKEHGVVTTRRNEKEKKNPHKNSKIYAVDCEMCGVGNDRVLTRVSVVDKELETIYDELVKPYEEITDYLTEYSGITRDMLENVTTRLKDVQKTLVKMIEPDSILVGHSLDFDLRALKLHHDNVIDTSVLYNDLRGPRYKCSLKFLAKTYLHQEIQNSSKGHCSVEDAKTCIELVNLKLKNGRSFGDPTLEKESIYEALYRVNKKGSLLDHSTIIRQHQFCNRGVPCITDNEVVKEAKKALKGSDFTFARIKTFTDYLGSEDNENNNEESLKKSLLEVDTHIGEILSDIPTASLVIVSFSSGYLSSDIKHLLKHKEDRKTDKVKAAIRDARNGICFVKIT